MYRYIKFYSLLFITVVLLGCSKDEIEPLFDQDSDTRVNLLLEEYKSILTQSEFGWKTRYQPDQEVGAYNIYLNFNEDNSVEVTSDLLGGIFDLETTYRVGITQFPELIFENYSTFHYLFESNNFSLGAEFEFLFEEVSEDQIIFKSKTDTGAQSTIVFEKASSTDQQSVISIRDFYDRLGDGFNTTSFLRNIVARNGSDEVVFNGTFTFYETPSRNAGISVFDSSTGALETTNYPIAITTEGFDLLEPLMINDNEISVFIFDETNNLYISEDGGYTTTIGYNLNAVTTELTPALFSSDVNTFGIRNTSYSYFDPSSSFHLGENTSDHFVNLGLSNSCGRIDIVFDDPDFGSYFTFYMSDGSFVFVDFSYTRVEDERIIFNFLQVYGDPTNVIGLINLLLDSNGFYVNETNESEFTGIPSYQLTSVLYPNFRFSVYGL